MHSKGYSTDMYVLVYLSVTSILALVAMRWLIRDAISFKATRE
jgi:hypothetical protein